MSIEDTGLPGDLLLNAIVRILWDAGFSVVPRRKGDPFDIHPSLVPGGWSYQWNDEPASGEWKPVWHHDHPGVFAQLGTTGPVTLNGMWLVKKLGNLAEEERKASVKRSKQQLEAWADRFGMFTGGATMLQTDGEEVVRTEIAAGKGVEVKTETFERPATKTVELVSRLPKDMIPYIDEVFAERDRISRELFIEGADGRPIFKYPVPEPHGLMVEQFWKAVEDDKGAPWWPTLNATILPYAIANVRKANAETGNADQSADGH